jgi:TPR repeat protein
MVVIATVFIALWLPYVAHAQDLTETRMRAEQGDVEAQGTLGFLYATGQRVPEDDAEAVRWYRLAAAQGDVGVQVILGRMHADGEGVPEDDAEAVRWYHRAAAQSHVSAQYNLGVMYSTGQGAPEDDVKAIWLYRSAARHGHVPAQFILGIMYSVGEGVPQNHQRAYMWAHVAAMLTEHQGYIAHVVLDVFEKRLTPEELTVARTQATHCYESTFTDCGEPQ